MTPSYHGPAVRKARRVVENVVGGEDIAFAEVVYMETDGDANLADADSVTTAPAVGIATGAISNQTAGEILTHGYFRNTAWSWTVGGDIFLSTTPGAMTQTPPSGSGDQVQVLGVAKEADLIFFNPSMTVVERV